MSDSAVNVVVSSRVRLARNYFDLPFLNWNRPENARLCIERAQAAPCGGEENYDPVSYTHLSSSNASVLA